MFGPVPHRLNGWARPLAVEAANVVWQQSTQPARPDLAWDYSGAQGPRHRLAHHPACGNQNTAHPEGRFDGAQECGCNRIPA